MWYLHHPLLSQAFKDDTGLPSVPMLPLGHLDAPWQSGAIYHFGEQDGLLLSKSLVQFWDKILRAGDCPETWKLLSLFFSAVQIYQAIARKGTQRIKPCQAQDQGPQRIAHSSKWV